MKAKVVCLVEPQKIEIVERELKVGPEDILVKSDMFSICGTDKNYYLGKIPRGTLFTDPGKSKGEVHRTYPFLLGHEGGGTILEVGSAVKEYLGGGKVAVGDRVGSVETGANVKNIKPGDYVISMGWHNCMADYWVGQDRADGHGVLLAPPGLSRKSAALGDAVTCAVYAGMESGVLLGDTVAVVGCGFAGQAMAQVVRRMGAGTVICVDPIDAKLEVAKKLGCDITLNPAKCDIVDEVYNMTKGKGVDVVIDAAGNSVSLQTCTDILKHGGIFGIYSWVLDPIELIVDRWHNDGFDIRTLAIMHRIMLDRRWWIDKTLQVVADGLVDCDSLLTHIFPFDKVKEAFECACSDDSAIKVGISLE